jgi:hypothetical protein
MTTSARESGGQTPDQKLMWVMGIVNIVCSISSLVFFTLMLPNQKDTIVKRILVSEIVLSASCSFSLAFTIIYFRIISKKLSANIRSLRRNGTDKNMIGSGTTMNTEEDLFLENTEKYLPCGDRPTSLAVPPTLYIYETISIMAMAAGTLGSWLGLGMWILVPHIDRWNSVDTARARIALHLLVASRVLDTACIAVGHAWAILRRKCETIFVRTQ